MSDLSLLSQLLKLLPLQEEIDQLETALLEAKLRADKAEADLGRSNARCAALERGIYGYCGSCINDADCIMQGRAVNCKHYKFDEARFSGEQEGVK